MALKGATKLLIGLLLIIAGIYSYITWTALRVQLINLVKLVIWNIPLWIILIGLVMIILGASDLKE